MSKVVLVAGFFGVVFAGYKESDKPTYSRVQGNEAKSEDSLRLAHVLFRHGERTIDRSTIYPNSPYKEETYFPYGIGQLTKEGQIRELNIGKYLRHRYDKYLGDLYLPDIVYARSTDVPRTKASLELVLAGLFPPIPEQQFDPDLKWQPIPYEFLPINQDTLLMGRECPNQEIFFKQRMNSKKMQKELSQFKELFQYLSKNSGWNITNYEDVFYLYFGLRSEDEWGLVLPEWSKHVYPQPMEDLVIRGYNVAVGNNNLKRLGIGFLLQKILNDSIAKSVNELQPPGRKIFLYSIHEFSIAYFLNTLGIFDNKIPPYGCFILVELHETDGNYGIKIFYQNYKQQEPKLLKLPGCSELCPLNMFAFLTQNYMPTEGLCGRRKCG